mgnify:CR=1 FL=1
MTTETDRELLEWAAKAAGMWKTDFALDDEDQVVYSEESGFYLAWGKGWWNPLIDDGDVLRLATHCEIAIKFTAIRVICKWVNIRCQERYFEDRNAATRRAVVRAAAAIGKAMPCPPKQPTFS